jgi:hypothetical protein
MAGESHTTVDHNIIRKWVEERGGRSATVKRTGSREEPGILRVDFPGYGGEESLEEIPWEEFFEKFEVKKLAFLYQEQTSSGEQSRFCKFINRERT